MLSNEQIEVVERMAATGFSYEEVCDVLLIDPSLENIRMLGPHYRKGFLLSELTLRERIFTDAGHGSSPAQALAKKILDDAKFKLENS